MCFGKYKLILSLKWHINCVPVDVSTPKSTKLEIGYNYYIMHYKENVFFQSLNTMLDYVSIVCVLILPVPFNLNF